ncbi:MAG: hypothetical protein ACPLXN_06495 [Sulfurihydrogenibium sp.]|uniref:hypothetical protein n=1 Tax=Sulfurihydrogenibium sp. TaxID=2053621 RepID=UPI003C7D5486
MKHKKTYYPVDPIPTIKVKEDDWWLATDIQKEVKKLTKKYISLILIGRMAKKYNLYKKTPYGFKLYHKDLVKILLSYLKQ